jgi:hypothetical protein
VKDTHQPSTAQLLTDKRGSFEARTKGLEASALRAAVRERKQSGGLATESTFNARTVQREVGMQSRVRHEWYSSGKIREIPLLRPDTRTWKNTRWEFQSREVGSLRITTQDETRVSRACATCGEQFVPKRSDAKTCSSSCRQAAYHQRKRTAEAQR